MAISADPHISRAVPDNPLPRRVQATAIRNFHIGFEMLRDAGGPVTRLTLAPAWLAAPIVLTTSPQGAHDVLGNVDNGIDKAMLHEELLQLIGPNLFNVKHQPWLPRRRSLQPIFTEQNVRAFAGDMARAAQRIADAWQDDDLIDLDTECRRLTLFAWGRSMLGLDLDEHAGVIAESLETALGYASDRVAAPVRLPSWLPLPARRRARSAAGVLDRLADGILTDCRTDPGRDAPLVRALIDAVDPVTGRGLADEEIRSELIAFIAAGHDTTATLLAYSLWALGRYSHVQQMVSAEVDALGHRQLTLEDVPRLHYTVQVLHEALRLCPPAAGVIREATRDVEIDGYRVESGSILIVGISAIHRDPGLWDRPLLFDPDRFAPVVRKGIDRWQYLPFGAGPRACIGDHFAMLEAALALATVIGRCEIHSCSDVFPLRSPFTTVADGPIRVRVAPRRPATTSVRRE
mgnify:CR=1 FL=1